jgi:hypothetical protein
LQKLTYHEGLDLEHGLDLRDTAVTEAGVRELRRALRPI